MNCKKIEELLPLYAGRDLEVKTATFVEAHLQTCAACAKAANEYDEAFQLTQHFAPPVFSAGVYAGMRQRVLRELETKERTPAWTPAIVGLFRPRLSWAVASVLLIAFSLFALYIVMKRGSDRKDLANVPASRHKSDSQDNRQSLPSPENKREPFLTAVDQDGSKKRRKTIVARMNDRNANSQNSLSARHQVPPRKLSEPAVLQPFDVNASGETIRVEMQTKDPNIRIIWFSQPNVKPGLPNSKGI
jgi:hypothetical protein